MAERTARDKEGNYGPDELGPWDDFGWGMINGKLSALKWVLGAGYASYLEARAHRSRFGWVAPQHPHRSEEATINEIFTLLVPFDNFFHLAAVPVLPSPLPSLVADIPRRR
jgi:hypothetical protein